jgi:hypothetical protein
LARRFGEEHPLALVLDVDQVREMLGGWLEQPTQAGALARRLAVVMARVHLEAGLDVIVPQYLGRLEFVLVLEQLCRDVDADFVEVTLVSNSVDAVRRFERRSATSASPAHQAAAALQCRTGGSAELRAMYDRLLEVVAARPATYQVEVVDGEIEQAYADLLAVLRR